ncbi:cobalt-precorrin-5B (C(1))-methyltransferase [Methylocapsa acidiphila]|uniref:cobalt-precorrin-5B (C(1))-methyltransferase n=1 Tax=Methylocapsa acidiphila TaxID=133552 RepID=UPI000412725B|nr:cobalt-precorrin-5B (C(1))-methyltransferase [Methylocapsa acidiphila]
MSTSTDGRPSATELRRGWTTGACAAAAARAAYEALLCGRFPDPVEILLPGGARPSFALAFEELGADFAAAGIVKDAGDDPDVTHGVLVIVRLSHGPPHSGVAFRAGPGVGIVTRPGLPLPPGEPAINPAPRRMISAAIEDAARRHGASGDVIVEISIPNGATIAERTLNARLGIVGGLSILGTTGIVVPYSCSAWIDTIHRGVDVARAAGLDHVVGATGSVSEAAAQALHRLPETALIEMGDFAGAFLKYLRRHPIPRVTIAGGFAKMTKLGQGLLDLHSSRGAVDLAWLAERCRAIGAEADLITRVAGANTAKEAADLALANNVDLPAEVAKAAWTTAAKALRGAAIGLEIAVFDREGGLLARTPFWAA